MNLTSPVIESAVNEFSKLPGIGKKTALRLVLHLIQQPKDVVEHFSSSLIELKERLQSCKNCATITEQEVCSICSNPSRNKQVICVVESLKEVLAIENTNQYKGRFHVLGGVISPMNGIGPEQLTINLLLEQVQQNQVTEVIMALNPTVDGDTTIFYISKRLKEINKNIKITTIARGVAFGGELEYVDEFTLARSLATRLPFDNYFKPE